MKSQYDICKECEQNFRCCKMVPPIIFQFERKDFCETIFFDKFKKQKISLLNKKEDNCIFLSKNKCSIYNKRPFNCVMFPLDIKKINKEFYWIIWDFCNPPNFRERDKNI
jgi:Fe-S-cluster containining protein